MTPTTQTFDSAGTGTAEQAWRELLQGVLIPNGEFVAVHWLGDSPDHALSGDGVHEILRESLGLSPLRSERHRGFRLDSWIKE